jgi:5'-3' exonuclease
MSTPLTAEQTEVQRRFAESTAPQPREYVAPPGKSLVLIDLSGIYWACWHSTADQEVSEAFNRTVGAVRALADGEDLVAVCCDCPPYHRRDLLPTYKAHRAEAPPLAVEQFERVKERLRADGFLLWGAPGFEADDVIAWAVAQSKLDTNIGPVTIASNDKDLHQLVSERVRCFSPMSRTYLDVEGVKEKHGVEPKHLNDYLALVGDSGDNVPGVPGVGPKTAAALLNAYHSLEAIIADAEKPEGTSGITKPKIKQALVDHAAAAYLARKIIALRTDVPLEWRELTMERQAEPIEDVQFEETNGRHKSEPPPPMPAAESTQLAVVETPRPLAPVAPEWSMGLEPHDLTTAYKLAKGLVNSRLYQKFQSAEAIWAVIIRGREMGLGALESLDSFHVVEGRPYPTAHLLVARAMKHPACEFFLMLESTDKIATYETKRRGAPAPTRLSYTIEQAERAGVVKQGGNWVKRPDEMLRKTAAVQLARAVYPESLGSAYAAEEING